MPDGSRLGIDWGKARIGVASCAARTSFAFPVTTVKAGRDELEDLARVIAETQPEVVYVGLPLDLRGDFGPAARFVVGKARALAQRVPGVEIRLIDERMSTASAARGLGSVGRNTRSQRAIIDQAAAVEILQRALDLEARTGSVAGELLDGIEDE